MNKIFSAIMLMVAVAFAACNTPNPPVGPNGPGQNGNQGEDTTEVVGGQGQGTLESPYIIG